MGGSDLTMQYEKSPSKEEAYNAVKAAVTQQMLAKFKVSASLSYEVDLIVAKGKGFKLDMAFSEDACLVSLNLSIFLRPLRGKILNTLEKQLKTVV